MPHVQSGECSIWYETRGSGEPLVLVYGIGGDIRQWWDAFPALLAERYRLVLIDNRGTGRSDRPESAWTMADMVSDVQAVVAAEGLAGFHLLGCSLGTVIVRQYSRAHPEKVRSLTLLCPPNGIAASEEDMRLALFWDRTQLESARTSWPVVHPEEWIQANDALLTKKFEESLVDPTPPRTFQFQLEASMAAGDPNLGLGEAGFPIFIAHGSADRLVPPENAFLAYEALPGSRIEIMDGLGHNLWQHAPEATAKLVVEFLDAVASGATK